jgi:hypothetical protein
MGILVPLWMTGYMGQSAWGALWFCLQCEYTDVFYLMAHY